MYTSLEFVVLCHSWPTALSVPKPQSPGKQNTWMSCGLLEAHQGSVVIGKDQARTWLLLLWSAWSRLSIQSLPWCWYGEGSQGSCWERYMCKCWSLLFSHLTQTLLCSSFPLVFLFPSICNQPVSTSPFTFIHSFSKYLLDSYCLWGIHITTPLSVLLPHFFLKLLWTSTHVLVNPCLHFLCFL